LAALAVGTCSVITGVVVPFATVLDKSVPVVPKVRAATLVTVQPEDGDELVIIPVALS
jgi:pentose-5-phosphate-3-epimerase